MFTGRINRWDPFHQLRDEMSRLLDDFSQAAPIVGRLGWRPSGVFPALNVWEDEQCLYAEAELPGFGMEELEVSVAGNELSIKGERKNERQEKGAYHRRERATGLFSRVLRLPVDIDASKVEATLRDGVLSVTLPKAEQSRPRKVQVKALIK